MAKEFLETITFTVENMSGITQNYAIFAGEPEIKPKVHDLRNDIFTSFQGVASHGGRAYFTMPRYQLSAICGTYIRSSVESGIQIEIVDHMSITLGSTSARGTVRPGTTCGVVIEDGSPVFAKHTISDGGNAKCFCVQTGADFTYQEASSSESLTPLTSPSYPPRSQSPQRPYEMNPLLVQVFTQKGVIECRPGSFPSINTNDGFKAYQKPSFVTSLFRNQDTKYHCLLRPLRDRVDSCRLNRNEQEHRSLCLVLPYAQDQLPDQAVDNLLHYRRRLPNQGTNP